MKGRTGLSLGNNYQLTVGEPDKKGGVVQKDLKDEGNTQAGEEK